MLVNGAGVKAPAGHVTGEDPISRCMPALSLPVQQNVGEVQVQRKFVFRALGLHPTGPAMTAPILTMMSLIRPAPARPNAGGRIDTAE